MVRSETSDQHSKEFHLRPPRGGRSGSEQKCWRCWRCWRCWPCFDAYACLCASVERNHGVAKQKSVGKPILICSFDSGLWLSCLSCHPTITCTLKDRSLAQKANPPAIEISSQLQVWIPISQTQKILTPKKHSAVSLNRKLHLDIVGLGQIPVFQKCMY